MTLKTLREGKFSKVLASYLAIQLFLQMTQPMQLFALTSGPSQPEFNSFTPIGTSDMVNLSTGDFNYNIPIMDVGGYPLNLGYTPGVTMDQEASWVGLGWNMNVGQIARNVRGIPDDFKGDEMRYENDMRDNITVGTGFSVGLPSLFGVDFLRGSVGVNVQYNNYVGITMQPSYGVSFDLSEKNSKLGASLGLNVSSATGQGASVSPNVGIKKTSDFTEDFAINRIGGNFGVGLNSRVGVSNFNLSTSRDRTKGTGAFLYKLSKNEKFLNGNDGRVSGGSSLPMNDQFNFTPTKRAGNRSRNFTFNASIGPSTVGAGLQYQVTGFGAFQGIRPEEKDKKVPAFGYEHTEKAEAVAGGGVLDFTREKDKSFNKFTTTLPVTSYSYDVYAIQGQGISGTYRPFRSQVGYVYDNFVRDISTGGTFGAEFGTPSDLYNGAEVKITNASSSTGKWRDRNSALGYFEELENDPNPITHEPVYFKGVGELDVDPELSIYNNDIYGDAPIRLAVGGNRFRRSLQPTFKVRSVNPDGTENYTDAQITNKIKRTKRHTRNQSIYNISNYEAVNDPMIKHRSEAFAKDHHTVGVKILKPDGSTYVFGESAYNTKKVEATFDVSTRSGDADCANGLVPYNGSITGNNSALSNKFLNRITTPAYAHTYALSAVLSSDYEDLTGDGPTDDDLGAYTKFTYATVNDYKWRTPFQENMASYNEGLKSNRHDETGNYIYGEKELKYVTKIETKTHVAIFSLSDRLDAVGVKGEHGGTDASAANMKKIDKIYLFTKPEYTAIAANFENLTYEEKAKRAIKIAHFNYIGYDENGNYNPASGELCPNVPNHQVTGGGKLTLDKVYFTYRNSYMGKYTPYKFHYGKLVGDELNYDTDGVSDGMFNPSYNMKSYDVWGNYKPNDGTGCDVDDPLTAQEFPFVQQTDRTKQDVYAKAWTLNAIDLPSGGRMEVALETDDYAYVQDRKAVQMFKVVGAGDSQAPSNPNTPYLYDNSDHSKFIYVKISDQSLNTSDQAIAQQLIEDHIGTLTEDPIYFRFLLNMSGLGTPNTPDSYSEKSDYVTGYFNIDGTVNAFNDSNGTYLALPLKELKQEGGIISSNNMVNPIAKSGWHFGRTYLNRVVYSSSGEPTATDFESIVLELVDSFGALGEIFNGPNKALQNRDCAKEFVPEKSWVRLLHPNDNKLGGGSRVKKVALYDEWDAMNTTGNAFAQHYGQEYDYSLADGENTSGVASFEPNSSKENPFVEPFYDKEGTKYADRLVSPQEENFTEKPLGETFYPHAMVTYGRVTVKNIDRKELDASDNVVREVRKHATGKVVTEFFTCKDFPTKSEMTTINGNGLDTSPKIAGLLNLSVRNHLTLSQGFSIITNDMNGKTKSQRVFAEGQSEAISGVDYKYNINTDKPNELDNVFTTITKDGRIEQNIIGQHYDIVNDFRENRDLSQTAGVNANLTVILSFFLPTPVFVPLPNYARHENKLRTASTTKVIHKSGILVEKVAYDLGATVSTKNIAWDAHTGTTLLTETINEYDDHYYNFTYPVHWAYDGMDKASINLGVTGELRPNIGEAYFNVRNKTTNTNEVTIDRFMKLGDQVLLYTLSGNAVENFKGKYWVAAHDTTNRKILLINSAGSVLNPCGEEDTNYLFKIVRSANKNQQVGAMASVTSMTNPIQDALGNTLTALDPNMFKNNNASQGINEDRIINASAVTYSDFWRAPNEAELPGYLAAAYIAEDGTPLNPETVGINPYLYNIKGEWRAVKSYAYLTGRNSNEQLDGSSSPRVEGYFTSFNPFYELNNGTWIANSAGWTFASEVSQYHAYGAELENRDALDRYSAAQYGYNFDFPVAVASNSRYSQIGYDGFEDYDYAPEDAGARSNPHFSFIDVIEAPVAARTEATSHTGRYSLEVATNQSVALSQHLGVVDVTPSTNSDCSEVDITGNDNCDAIKERTVTITGGIPNDIYEYDFVYRAGTDACWRVDYPEYKVSENGGPFVISPQGDGTVQLDANGNGTFTFSVEFRGGFYGQSYLNGNANANDNILAQVNLSSQTFMSGGPFFPVTVVDFGCLFNDEIIDPQSPTIQCGLGLGTTVGNNGGNTGGNNGPRYSSFNPSIYGKEGVEKYIISAWVKEEHAEQQQTYENTEIVLKGNNNAPFASFAPQGAIIEGWQRISGVFEIPEGANVFTISLENLGNTPYSYFDDIRIYPFNGNLKSFVYDPETLRLVSELDENNYATFYEYDREGGLIRVKKETDRGVYTIQETRSGTSKLNGQ